MSARSFSGRVSAGATHHKVEVHFDGRRLLGTVDGNHVEAEAARGGPGEVVLRIDGRRVVAVVVRTGGKTLVAIEGRTVEVARADAHHEGAEGGVHHDPFAVSPMTGLVTKVHVKAKDPVKKGAPLFAVEAMKMEYVVKADRDLVVDQVARPQGSRVQVGEVVVTFAAP